MAEPVDIDPIDYEEIGQKDDEWGDDLMNDLERRFNELRHFNSRLETSSHEEFREITLERNKLREDTIELVANQIYDRITKLINDRRERLGIKRGAKIGEPIRIYDSFDLDDNGNLTFTYKNRVIDLGDINEGLNAPSKIFNKLSVKRLKNNGL